MMEDTDWGQPLLKDCLFSDLTLPEISGSQYLFDDDDELSSLDPSIFGEAEDLKAELRTVNGTLLPSSTTHNTHCLDHSNHHHRTLADLDSRHPPSNLCAHQTLIDSLSEDVRVKSEPNSLDGDCCNQDDMFSEDSYCPQNDDYSTNLGNLGSPLSPHAQTSVITSLYHNGARTTGSQNADGKSQNGIVATGYSTSISGPNAANRYSALLPTTTTATTMTSSPGPSPSRPRLLIATLPSNNLTVIKRRHLEVLDSSPSPPSSNGSSPSDGLGPGPCFGPLRNRSKMHELAVKSRLITEQDPRGNGSVVLSPEEKRTLVQEGYTLPTKLPLTKAEEEALKVVRRKIKNKLSAQESRRKRKEYMETLEQKVQNFHSENASLRQRVRQLEQNNRSLTGQLRKLQNMVGVSVGNVSIATQTGVCLTAFMLLFAVFIPTFPSVLPAQIGLWRTWNGPPESEFLSPMDLLRQTPAASRVLLAGKEENCDIPYSAKFFHSEEDGKKTLPAEDEVRSEQKELFSAAGTEQTEEVSVEFSKETANRGIFDQLNLSALVDAQQNGGNLKNAPLNNCDLSSCAQTTSEV